MNEPRSAIELQLAMDALASSRRANPPRRPAGPFVVEVQYPEGGSPWHPLATWNDLDVAMDTARSPDPRPPVGSAVCVVAGDDVVWLGVAGDGGATLPAPKFTPPPQPSAAFREGETPGDWVAAWDGPWASGAWMLSNCGLVARLLVAAAVHDCALESIGIIPEEDRAPFVALLREVRAWPGGPRRGDELVRAERAASEAVAAYRRVAGYRSDVSKAMLACRLASTCTSCDPGTKLAAAAADVASTAAAALCDLRGSLPGEGRTTYLEAVRSLAPIVRRSIPMGMMLLPRAQLAARMSRVRSRRT